MSERAIFVHGKPGSGKSTCCAAVVEAPGVLDGLSVRHLPVGTRFRGILTGDIDSNLAEEVYGSTDEARSYRLPPSILVHKVVEEYLRSVPGCGVTLIDGYPKEPEQLPLISRSVATGLVELAGVIVVDVSDDEALHRQRSRQMIISRHEDFDPSVAQRRIAEFSSVTEPVIDLLGGQVPVLRISGELPIDETIRNFRDAVSLLVVPVAN